MAASGNHYYGHNAILARYVGLDAPKPILGYMLHGWYPWFPWMPDIEVIRSSVPKGFPVIAWSKRDLRMLNAGGISNAVAIGAPFLYLLSMRGIPEPAEGRSLVSFPFHTLANAGFEDAWGEYARYLESLTGYDRITVCLYHLEYSDSRMREQFERRGFETATNGRVDDPAYLDRFYDLVSRHTDVTSNRISTAVVYGAAAARRAFLGGPVPAVTSQQTAGPIPDEGRRAADFQRERFPELIEGLEPDAALGFGAAQLGSDCMLGPEELRAAIGWSGVRQLGARAAAAATSLRRLVRGAG